MQGAAARSLTQRGVHEAGGDDLEGASGGGGDGGDGERAPVHQLRPTLAQVPHPARQPPLQRQLRPRRQRLAGPPHKGAVLPMPGGGGGLLEGGGARGGGSADSCACVRLLPAGLICLRSQVTVLCDLATVCLLGARGAALGADATTLGWRRLAAALPPQKLLLAVAPSQPPRPRHRACYPRRSIHYRRAHQRQQADQQRQPQGRQGRRRLDLQGPRLSGSRRLQSPGSTVRGLRVHCITEPAKCSTVAHKRFVGK